MCLCYSFRTCFPFDYNDTVFYSSRISLICQTEFKYSGLDCEGDIQSRDFINLKKNLKAHLQSQKHVAKEVQMKKEKEKTKKLLK